MEQLLALLQDDTRIDEYLVQGVKTESKELFFIKNELQMNRGKDVEYYYVTVYKNFEENDTKYKGSSSCKIALNMTEEEMKSTLELASIAAANVKNEYYELQAKNETELPAIESSFLEGNIIDDISKLVEDLFQEDNQYDAWINSVEFFIDKKRTRLVNSNGLDVSFDSVRGEIELVTEANGTEESIELFEILHFSDYNQEAIKKAVKEELYYASLRAKAIPMPQVDNLPVIIKGTSAEGLFSYYEFKASASALYQKMHNHAIGEDIQGSGKGDRLTLEYKAVLPYSSHSSYVDQDGVFLEDTIVIKEGILKQYQASKRFADYLDIKASGMLSNMKVYGGRYSESELKKGPYLELLKFSAFQADSMTGDFGGEFRLGIYFDGETKIPVTLASVSGNLAEAGKEMYLSKELEQKDNIIVPKIIKFSTMSIAGNK